jgi:hypothetical protein
MGDLSLDAFETSLRSRKSTWFIQEGQIAFPPGFNDMIMNDNPHFQRTVLLLNKDSSELWRYLENWHSILTIDSNQDWSLALTHLLYQPKHTLVIVCPELFIPIQVLQKLNGITLVQFAYYKGVLNRAFLQTDCHLIQQTGLEQEIDFIYSILQQTNQPHTKQNLKDILRDTKTVSASILISGIDEPKGKQLYWYYAPPIAKSSKVDLVMGLMQSVLRRLV